ncbi:MAG: outer membrane protein assembly factor BamB family protein [Pirellulales bacterium]
MRNGYRLSGVFLGFFLAATAVAEDWVQLKFDARRSGDAGDRDVATPLGLVGAARLGDAVFTAPVVAAGRVYVVDGSGTAFAFDAATLKPLWTFPTRGGAANCNNVSSPAVAGGYLHFGTMAGYYYVLDAATGKPVKEIACGEPVFSAPVVNNGRVYFVTLGSRLYAVELGGKVAWTWDFVRERLKFSGDRWSAADWLAHKKGRATWRDQFCSAGDMAADGRRLVVPAGGAILWLEDAGDHATFLAEGLVPSVAGNEKPGLFGLSIGQDGAAYEPWHRRDNTGRVETLRLEGGKVRADFVPGTMTANDMPWSLSFSSVSLRGQDVYRCRPEEGFGLCRHAPGQKEPQSLGGSPSVAAPIVLKNHVVSGGLDGKLHVVPLAGGSPWSFSTAFGKAITAPVCVADGRIYFGCEDGYLYALGPGGKAPLPKEDLGLWKIRSPLGGRFAAPRYDWYTSFGNFANTNSAVEQGIKPPLKLKWIRRYEGTFKHLPVCGGGRLYTHTAEGQIFAVEQETGRLLWRRFWSGVHVSFTAPLYYQERLLVPQAGLEKSRLRCLDAATGELIWEAPFTGSPSWSRQQPPVVHKNLAIYMFGTGKYVPKGSGLYVMRMNTAEKLPEKTDGTVSWLYSHDNPFYPKDQHAVVQAWDIRTGQVAWTRDFSQYGFGGDDAGLCLMDGVLYYSCFFGYAAQDRNGQPAPHGLTAALDPATGEVRWLTTHYSVTAGCTISGDAGRLYLGGYNQPDARTDNRYVWCLDARDGSLVWQSEPVTKAINVVTVGPEFVFVFAYGGDAYLLDKPTGKIRSKFNHGYACTRFSLASPYLLGSNTDMVDLAAGARLVSTGPPLDPRECVGAVASNGRIFYNCQANGLQVCQLAGEEAAEPKKP